MLQAAGSWSYDACCAVHGNDCGSWQSERYCNDSASSSDWLFGLWPGPPQRYETTGADNHYQILGNGRWPEWGNSDDGQQTSGPDLRIGTGGAPPGRAPTGAPGGSDGWCRQGTTYRGTDGEICGGNRNWGAPDVEVWYPL